MLARTERQSATPSAAAALICMAASIDVTEALGVVSVPTLVLHRRDDPNLRVEAARELAAGIRGTRYVELEGTDHIPWFGNADVILDEIEELLTGSRHRDDAGSPCRLVPPGDVPSRAVRDHFVITRRPKAGVRTPTAGVLEGAMTDRRAGGWPTPQVSGRRRAMRSTAPQCRPTCPLGRRASLRRISRSRCSRFDRGMAMWPENVSSRSM